VLDPSVIHYYRKEFPERMMQNIKTHEENFIHTLESSKRKDRERLSLVMVKPKFKIT